MTWTASKRPAQRGDPNLAAILTWFVPGAGHLYLGMPLFALSAFAVVQGLYWAGLKLSDGMLFEFLQIDLRGTFAGALSPEVGNLGMLVWHTRQYGDGPGFPRSWPEHIHLGSWLTALSGILNACLMVRAHVDARLAAGQRRPGLAPPTLVLLAWLVPGLGHLCQGRHLRGVLVFVLLVGLLALGTFLAQGSNLDRERHFYYWAGQFLTGAPAMLLELAHGYPRVTSDIQYLDAGLGMVCVAGLLNVLAMLDVFGYADAQSRAMQAAPPGKQGSAEAGA